MEAKERRISGMDEESGLRESQGFSAMISRPIMAF
jgi:hypothetical protein